MRIIRMICVTFGALLLFSFFMCDAEASQAAVSYRSVPGVTNDEIEAVEALRKHVSSFVYGVMSPSTEAFLKENGEIGGFSALFCEYLTELFGIPFTPAIYEWPELLRGLETGAIDFA